MTNRESNSHCKNTPPVLRRTGNSWAIHFHTDNRFVALICIYDKSSRRFFDPQNKFPSPQKFYCIVNRTFSIIRKKKVIGFFNKTFVNKLITHFFKEKILFPLLWKCLKVISKLIECKEKI